jgi:hypothetical protein
MSVLCSTVMATLCEAAIRDRLRDVSMMLMQGRRCSSSRGRPTHVAHLTFSPHKPSHMAFGTIGLIGRLVRAVCDKTGTGR